MVLVPELLFWITNSREIFFNPVPDFGTRTAIMTRMVSLYIFAALFFFNWGSKRSRMFYLSLPVTSLERVAVAFTFMMVLMPVLVEGLNLVSHFIFVPLFDYIHGTSLQEKELYAYSEWGLICKVIFYNLSLCSIFALGSLIFGQGGSVITLLIFSVPFAIYKWLWWSVLVKLLAPNTQPEIILYFIFPACWVAMYFVMKKKEVHT
jgi:hypothetical protein